MLLCVSLWIKKRHKSTLKSVLICVHGKGLQFKHHRQFLVPLPVVLLRKTTLLFLFFFECINVRQVQAALFINFEEFYRNLLTFFKNISYFAYALAAEFRNVAQTFFSWKDSTNAPNSIMRLTVPW